MLLLSVPIFAFTAGGTLVLSWRSRRLAAVAAGGFSFRKRGIMIAAVTAAAGGAHARWPGEVTSAV